MTEDNHTTAIDARTERQTDEERGPLGAGQYADDIEETGTLVIIADAGTEAGQHTVATAGETVAELNPKYPADDNVLFCTYRNALDTAFGETWRHWTTDYLAFKVGDRGVPTYSFPESRLERKPPEWEDEHFTGNAGDEEDDA